MDYLRGAVGGGGGGGRPASGAAASASLSAQWQAYSGAPDEEAGGGSAGASSASAPLLAGMDSAAAALKSALGGAASALGGLPGAASSAAGGFAIPSAQALMTFFVLEAVGAALLFLAFMVFGPLLVVAPAKFALCLTLGCLAVFGGFASLRGWRAQAAAMLDRETLPLTAAYLGSILATLYAAVIAKSYLLCLGCSAAQVVAMLYYILSGFPGGPAAIKFFLSMLFNAAWGCCGTVQRMVFR
jgi:hypothetical protein